MGSIDHAFDIASARTHFPALKQKQVYFDNAGGSQVLGEVITSVERYLSDNNVQMGSTYEVGMRSSAKFMAGYDAAAKYINASSSEIVIGPSVTQLFRNLSFALDFHAGDELIISGLDHEANIAPWVSIAARLNLKVTWWRPRDGGGSTNPKLEVADLQRLLTTRTKLVTCTHTSNILGSIHDIKALTTAVHAIPGAMICVDAVAYAPHRRIDVKELGVDFYAFSWYKVYGPHVSMLYAREAAQTHLLSLGHFFSPTTTLENKLGLAGSNYELTQSIPCVVDYFGPSPQASFDAIAAHEEALAAVLLTYLTDRGDATIYGEPGPDASKRVPTIAFRLEGYGSREVVERVDRSSAFGIRWGMFYSNRLVAEVLGLDVGGEGVVRVSMVHYNTLQEIKGLCEKFEEVVPVGGGGGAGGGRAGEAGGKAGKTD